MRNRSKVTPNHSNQQSNVSHDVNKKPIFETIVKKIIKTLSEDERFYNINLKVIDDSIIGSYKYGEKDANDTSIAFTINKIKDDKGHEKFMITYTVNGLNTEYKKILNDATKAVDEIYNIGGDSHYFQFIDDDGNIINDNENQPVNDDGNIINDDEKSKKIDDKIISDINKQSDKMLCEHIGSTIKKQLEDQPGCYNVKYNVNDDASVSITYDIVVLDSDKNKLSVPYKDSVAIIVKPSNEHETCEITTTIKKSTGQTIKKREKMTIGQIKKHIEAHQFIDNHEYEVYDVNNPNIEESSLEEEEDIKNIEKKNHYAVDEDKKNNHLKNNVSIKHIDNSIAIDGYDNQHQEDKSSDEEWSANINEDIDEGVADIKNLEHTAFHSSILNNK